MRKVVSNTTPIIALIKLNRLDILEYLYGQIHIPLAVYQEIKAGRTKGYYQDISKINWINIARITDQQAVRYFLDLDDGEAEAIVLATEIKADLIILDEKLGRCHANHAGLNVTGTIGVLIKAKKEGLIPKLKPLLTALKEKDVWISDKLKYEILKQVGEVK